MIEENDLKKNQSLVCLRYSTRGVWVFIDDLERKV